MGYAGRVGLPEAVEVVWDLTAEGRTNFEAGANKTDNHNINVNFERDVKKPDKFIDVRLVKTDENCPQCQKGRLKELNTIELGHVFKLGTIYSIAMGASFVDENNKSKPLVMGCYGIGMTRILSAAVEQHHDDKGIIWPASIAPFKVHLISLKDGEAKAGEIYRKLMDSKIEVLWDEREESAGVKFADADLIGIPIRLVVSKKTGEEIELKMRAESNVKLLTESELFKILE